MTCSKTHKLTPFTCRQQKYFHQMTEMYIPLSYITVRIVHLTSGGKINTIELHQLRNIASLSYSRVQLWNWPPVKHTWKLSRAQCFVRCNYVWHPPQSNIQVLGSRSPNTGNMFFFSGCSKQYTDDRVWIPQLYHQGIHILQFIATLFASGATLSTAHSYPKRAPPSGGVEYNCYLKF